MPPSDDPEIVRRAQRVDLARAVPLGVLLPLETSVLVTIALKHFDAPGLVKGVIAAANGVGLLATPLITSWARRWGRPAMVPVAVLSFIGTLGFLAAATGALPLFVVGSVIGVAMVNGMFTLMTVTYDRNFPARERGRRVGRGLSVKVLVSALAGLAMGTYLNSNLDRWWVVILAGAAASAMLIGLNLRVPSEPLAKIPGVRDTGWPHFHLLAEDRRLRLTLGAWMLMGFGNLMLMPLRVEYLGNSQYGISADASKIVVLTVVVPSAVRLVSMPLFGMVFDHLSFFSSRILVNVLFAMYVAAFFTGTSDASLVVGSVLLGIGAAGGDLMWSLWVTKFAPAGRVADYMGLHTFSTGLRAVVAPIVGFAILGHVALGTVALLSAGLMLAASFILIPEMRAERTARALAAGATLQPTGLPGGN